MKCENNTLPRQKEPESTIDAAGLDYRELNRQIRGALGQGASHVRLENVLGQRYIGDGLTGESIELELHGVAGNDLAAFMDGPRIEVYGNAQDAVANTMNAGEVIVHGHAGDIAAHAMRGGRVFIRGNAGYRAGIHMKAYRHLAPLLIVGGKAGDFLGEYMAGGTLIVLGIEADSRKVARLGATEQTVGDFIGTGMHGGRIYIRGQVDPRCLGKEVKAAAPDPDDMKLLQVHISNFCEVFGLTASAISPSNFVKLYPYTHRPYGRIYAY